MFALVALAVVLAPTQAIPLRFSPTIGKTYRYQVVSDVVVNMGGMKPMPMKQNQTVAMKALSRRGTGTELQVTVESLKIVVPKDSPMAGMASQMEKGAAGKSVKVVIGADGSPQAGSLAGPAQAMQGLAFPKGPVKAGDKWTTTVDLGKAAGAAMGAGNMKASGKMPISLKLVSLANQAPYGKVARIGVSMSGTMTSSPMGSPVQTKISGNGEFSAETATGMVVTSKTTVKNVTTLAPGRTMTQTVVSTMTRLR